MTPKKMGAVQICPSNLAQTARLRAHAPRKALPVPRAFSAQGQGTRRAE